MSTDRTRELVAETIAAMWELRRKVELLAGHLGVPCSGTPIAELDLSTRCRYGLQLLGICWIEELQGLKERDLLGVRNFGVTSLGEIKRELEKRGMSLAK